jgi:hypothetical protein
MSDEQKAEVSQKIDSLRKKAEDGALSDDLLEDVAGGAAHTDGVIHTDGTHSDGVIHTDSGAQQT